MERIEGLLRTDLTSERAEALEYGLRVGRVVEEAGEPRERVLGRALERLPECRQIACPLAGAELLQAALQPLAKRGESFRQRLEMGGVQVPLCATDGFERGEERGHQRLQRIERRLVTTHHAEG